MSTLSFTLYQLSIDQLPHLSSTGPKTFLTAPPAALFAARWPLTAHAIHLRRPPIAKKNVCIIRGFIGNTYLPPETTLVYNIYIQHIYIYTCEM